MPHIRKGGCWGWSFVAAGLLCWTVVLSGCGILGSAKSADTASGASGGPAGGPPIELSVAGAEVINGTLHVHVVARAKAAVDARRVVVALKGMNRESVAVEDARLLGREIGSDPLEAGRDYRLELTLPAKGLTDYQVQCSWGDDAAAYTGLVGGGSGESHDAKSADRRTRGFGGVEFDSYQVSERPMDGCSGANCESVCSVSALLANHGTASRKGIVLALGVVWVGEGENVPELPREAEAGDNEQMVNLPGVVLEPGASKQLRLTLDRPIPKVPGGAFVPTLRVLGFDAAR